jgi:hypothetical protein
MPAVLEGHRPAFGALKALWGSSGTAGLTDGIPRQRIPANWVRLASAYDLERWATDDLPAVPMPHLIGLRSIY